MLMQTWADILTRSFMELWMGFIAFVPVFLFAILVFIAGWIIASIAGGIVERISNKLKLDKLMDKLGIKDLAERAGVKFSVAKSLNILTKVFVIVVFLLASLEILGLYQVSVFLRDTVLAFIPKVFVAVIILILAAVIAEFVRDVVVGTARTAGVKGAALLGAMAKWAVWIFAIVAALFQLGVATAFLQTLFAGFVIALSLAFGLAFGLGGKDTAAKILQRLEEDIKNKES